LTVTRLVTIDDAAQLADLVTLNREFLAPWEPMRPDDYFTRHGQQAIISDALGRCEAGTTLPHVILGAAGEIVGRITLNGIVRGPFQSCSVGYWVSAESNGQGRATAALGHIVAVAFGELGLHRIQAETLEHNLKSQRVLERNGFVRIGLAPRYLCIAGRWQDHLIYQVINTSYEEPRAANGSDQ